MILILRLSTLLILHLKFREQPEVKESVWRGIMEELRRFWLGIQPLTMAIKRQFWGREDGQCIDHRPL
jgi:hypothetical protein